ncbi:dihydrolipoyl dehydrogenase [Actinospica durhamensis]|uniref:Dihydrolipoyl dehydrogenase n=1 Tax=Actinospica durhamensis TaxID=1508375 RepID=A0A941EKD6_9ACTN|nr:dihydrolipoyl dehydrogenase [Actinospica durhamensis]MBR7832132.1 dihydrolipoyl dehydrogenase [Actinospica durhamensis]
MAEAGNVFDVVILGGGSGGYACAFRAADLGMNVALIEKAEVGGTCLHRGCIPTKALLHAAEVADLAREGESFGVKTVLEGIDMPGVNKYKDGVVSGLYKGLQGIVKARKITFVAGEGTLSAPNQVTVNGEVYTGRNVVLATGSVPKSLPGLEIDGQRIISSDHALKLDRVPASVVILGGGVIGCEFASVYKSFGADVTIVEFLPHLVPNEDVASSKLLERAFRRRGIKFEIDNGFTGVEAVTLASGDSGVRVSTAKGKTFDAELLLVAVGRGPVSAGLGFEQAGVAVDRGYVKVNEYCQTSVPNVYAVGDLIPTLQLAHVGFAEGILVAEHIAGLDPRPIDYDGVPRVTYSNPEVASCGLTEVKAAEKYGADHIKTFTYNLAGNGKSKILKTQGEIKLVQIQGVAGEDDRVVGIHMVGDRVGELVAEAQLIYNWDATAGDVAQFVHAHPTQGEALGEAHMALAGKPLHVHD